MQHTLKTGVAVFVLLAAQPAFAQDKAAVDAGAQVYATNCAPCHGERLTNSGGMPDLKTLRPDDKPKFDAVVTDGKGQMPAWDGTLTGAQIDQVWAYIRSVAD